MLRRLQLGMETAPGWLGYVLCAAGLHYEQAGVAGCPCWRNMSEGVNLPDLSDHQPGSPAQLGHLTRSDALEPPGGVRG